MSQFLHDARYALRGMRRDAAFFAVAVLIVGLGAGASTAIFSVVNGLLLRGLPFRDPARLVWVANTGKSNGLSAVTSRAFTLRDWRRSSTSFDGLTGYFAFFDYVGYNLVGTGDPERCVGVGVEHEFLPVLGVGPRLGRGFTREESEWNGPRAVILTDSFWKRRFGADPGIVGRSISLDGQPTSIVGVLPASFDFASIFSPTSRIDFLVPFPISDQTDQMGNTLAILGRLKPGVTVERAQAELTAITQQIKDSDPGRRGGWGARVSPLEDHVTGRYHRPLAVLAAAVLVVLLIACANLSNLLLARGASRRKEMALRSALGAGRGRLVGQLLVESLLLSLAGAAVGVLLAVAATKAIASASAVAIPLLGTVGVDAAALAFTLAVAVCTGLVVGVLPALHLSGTGEHDALNDSSRGSTEKRSRALLRNALVGGEIALAFVLLVGAGLLLRSFVALLDTDLGFRPAGAAAWRIETGPRYAAYQDKLNFYTRLVQDIRGLPAVESVGLTDALPLGRNRSWTVAAKGEVYRDGQRPTAFPRIVDSGYLRTMGIPIVAGRDLSPFDTAGTEFVVLVNRTMAARLWPGKNAVGQILLNGQREWRVVGIAGNVRHSSLEEEAGMEMYMPITQQRDFLSLELVIRTKLPPEQFAASVRAAVRAIDPTVPASDLRPLEVLVDRAISPRRFIVFLVGAFAAAALFLASLGIYGVVSYSVNQRSQEIGIRMALGASPAGVQARVVGGTLALAGAGVVLGLAASLALSKLLSSMLYGVTATDPVTFGGTVMLLLALAAVAGYLPARRAARVDPNTVLRV